VLSQNHQNAYERQWRVRSETDKKTDETSGRGKRKREEKIKIEKATGGTES
jgi:hypothetical protein